MCNLVDVKQWLISVSQSVFLMYSADADDVVEREMVEFQGHVVRARRPVLSLACPESLMVRVTSLESYCNHICYKFTQELLEEH